MGADQSTIIAVCIVVGVLVVCAIGVCVFCGNRQRNRDNVIEAHTIVNRSSNLDFDRMSIDGENLEETKYESFERKESQDPLLEKVH